MRPGERVELVRTTDPFTHLRPGARGTVLGVDDLGTIHVAWDCGSALGVVPDEDEIRHVAARYEDGCALCRRANRA